jgi:hypothetical protein
MLIFNGLHRQTEAVDEQDEAMPEVRARTVVTHSRSVTHNIR